MLRLFSDGLLSRHGFNDGDAPDEFYDWLEEQGREYVPLSWHRILRELVTRRLVPALDQQVETVCIGTSHNPVRARTVDGADAERFWSGEHDDAPRLTPEFVEVPFAEVFRVAVELGYGDAEAGRP